MFELNVYHVSQLIIIFGENGFGQFAFIIS